MVVVDVGVGYIVTVVYIVYIVVVLVCSCLLFLLLTYVTPYDDLIARGKRETTLEKHIGSK